MREVCPSIKTLYKLLEGYERMLQKENFSTKDQVFQVKVVKFQSKGSSYSRFNEKQFNGQPKWTFK